MKKLPKLLVEILFCVLMFYLHDAFLLCCFASSTKENFTQNPHIQSIKKIKLKPRLSFYSCTGENSLISSQFLMPIVGDNTKALYSIILGNYVANDSSWLAGLGFGYRKIVDKKIYGIYSIVHYANTSNNDFFIENVGLELLSSDWDFNINGYIPMNKGKKLGQEGWAGDTFGLYDYSHATGHDFYDHRLQYFEEAGRGLDVEIAKPIYFLPKAKIHFGGYHFDTSESGSINGVETKLTYAINKNLSLELEYNYDNIQYNKILAGIKFTFGNYDDQEKDAYGIATRLLETIDTDHMILTHSSLAKNMRNSVAPVDQGEKLEHDNIWYFSQSGSSGDGTAERPFVGIAKQDIDIIYENKNKGTVDKYPVIYFSSGTYNFSTDLVSRGIEHRLALYNGWSIYGRTSNFLSPALDEDRPLFIGGIDLGLPINDDANQESDPTILNSIKIVNDKGSSDQAVAKNNASLFVKDNQNIVLQNVFIKNEASQSNGDFYIYAVYADNSTLNFNKLNEIESGANQVIAHGTITTPSVISNVYAYGIYAQQLSNVNFNNGNNSINVATNINGNAGGRVAFSSNAYGIYSDDSTIKVINGTNSIVAQGDIEFSNTPSTTAPAIGVAINAFNNSKINFYDGINFFEGIAVGYKSGDAYGIALSSSELYFYGGTNSLKATGNYKTYVANQSSGFAHGIYAKGASGNNKIVFANSTIKLNIDVHAPTLGTTYTSRRGIEIDAGSDNQIFYLVNGIETPFSDTTISSILDYVNFTGTGKTSSGYKVRQNLGSSYPDKNYILYW